jgi:hypothetical protein
VTTYKVVLEFAFPPQFEVLVRARTDGEAKRLAIDLATIAGFTGRVRKIRCARAQEVAA